MLKDYSSFVMAKKKEPGMADFSQVSESCVEKIIEDSKVTNCQTDPIPSKFIKKYLKYIDSSHYLSNKLLT